MEIPIMQPKSNLIFESNKLDLSKSPSKKKAEDSPRLLSMSPTVPRPLT